MKRSLIFMGAWSMVACTTVFFERGKQVRRERDVLMAQKSEMQLESWPNTVDSADSGADTSA